MRGPALLLLLAATAMPAAAAPANAEEPAACAGFKWSVARERAAFSAGTLPAVASGGSVPAPGTAVALTLSPQDAVAYSVKPKRAPRAAPAYGAEVTGTVGQAGTYAVTLSDDAWVDLAQNGEVLHQVGFSGQKGCPGVRKTVHFTLVPGPVTISISDASAPTLNLDLLSAE